MSNPDRIPLRDARDALTDGLGFGLTAPIENLPVIHPPAGTSLTISPGESDTIELGFSQTAVRYRLGRGGCDPQATDGNAGTGTEPLALDTGVIQTRDDFIANICAHKNGYTVALAEKVRVRAGLDEKLPARILIDEGTGTQLLDPSLQRPYPDDAERIAPFGWNVRVRIDNAQSGVDYLLLSGEGDDEKQISLAVRGRGSGQYIVLSSSAIDEDSVLRVRASRGDNIVLLDARLPLKIRANPDLQLNLIEGAIAEYGAAHQLKISNSQRSVHYQVFARTISDVDYENYYSNFLGDEHSPPIDIDYFQATATLPDDSLTGFTAVTQTTRGNNGELILALPPAEHDRLLLVRASKEHSRTNGGSIGSALRMHSALALLVKPDPAQPVKLLAGLTTSGAVQSVSVLNGEPGVFYQLHPQPETPPEPGVEPSPNSAYMHQRHALDPSQYKGIAASAGDASTGAPGLAIGRDFAIARDPQAWEIRPAIGDPPLTPAVDIDTSSWPASGGNLFLLAKRAQTGLQVEIPQQAEVPPIAAVSADASEIPAGQSARIVVTASNPDDRYELWRFGGEQPERRARNGNGGELVFNSDAINADTLLLMRVTRREQAGPKVTRELRIPITTTITDPSDEG